MMWTTSAYPWAEHARASRDYPERRQLQQPSESVSSNLFQPLASRVFARAASNPATLLQAAILGHFALVVVLLTLADESATTLAILTSGAFLAIAVPYAIRGLEIFPQDRKENCGVSIESACKSVVQSDLHAEVRTPVSEAQQTRTEITRPNIHNPDWADLMARMSHELRTPLNAVLGFSDVMHKGLLGPLGHERYHEYARHIHESGRELLKSAEDTLAVTSLLANPEECRQQDCLALHDLLRDAWSFFGERPSMRGISCRIDVDTDVEVIAERRTLRQALINLISEGLVRAKPGTAIVITAVSSLGRVTMQISLEDTSAATDRGPCSLDICLARKLLELQGASVLEEISVTGAWQVSTQLDQAIQRDFFNARF